MSQQRLGGSGGGIGIGSASGAGRPNRSGSNHALCSEEVAGVAGLAGQQDSCPITCVQLSGLVVMKIIKHYHDESTLNFAQGALLGLVVDKCLEVTNCFAIPYNKGATGTGAAAAAAGAATEESFDDVSYQLAVMHRWKSMNVDNFHVGWYQSSDIGSCLTLNLLEVQFHYQTSIEESIVIVYDTLKSTRGFLNFKAYRLTPQAIKMYKDNNFSPDVLRSLKVGYESLFAEVPIVIKNSPLANIMMSELTELLPEEEGNNFLDLGTASVLESDMRSLIDRLDELYPEVLRYNRYQQILMKQETEKHRALAKQAVENTARVARGECPISDDEVLKQFRPIPGPQRLAALITSGQINNFAQHMSQLSSQSLAKLFITESLQKAKDSYNKDNK